MLPKKHKLKRKDFSGFQRWKSFQSPHLTLRTKEAPQGDPSKFSFVVSKKISKKSTTRNKLKRFGSRATEEIVTNTAPGVFCAFFFKGGGAELLSYEKIKEEVFFLLKKAGVILEK